MLVAACALCHVHLTHADGETFHCFMKDGKRHCIELEDIDIIPDMKGAPSFKMGAMDAIAESTKSAEKMLLENPVLEDFESFKAADDQLSHDVEVQFHSKRKLLDVGVLDPLDPDLVAAWYAGGLTKQQKKEEMKEQKEFYYGTLGIKFQKKLAKANIKFEKEILKEALAMEIYSNEAKKALKQDYKKFVQDTIKLRNTRVKIMKANFKIVKDAIKAAPTLEEPLP